MEKNNDRDVSYLLGYNLKRIRKNVGMTQEILSEKLGISQKHLSMIETGNQFASSSLIDKLAEILDIPVSALFESESTEIQLKSVQKSICDYIDMKIEDLYARLTKS